MIGQASILFEENCGILAPYGEYIRDADHTNKLPSINIGDDADFVKVGELLEQLARGNTYIQVMPESDMPYIGILPMDKFSRDCDAEKFFPRMMRIGYQPVCIAEKMQRRSNAPMFFPGLARWLLGWKFSQCTWDIGGHTDNANLTPETDIFRWHVVLRFSDRPLPPIEPNMGMKLEINLWQGLTHAVADAANTRNAYMPAMYWPLNAVMARTSLYTAGPANTDVANFTLYGYNRLGVNIGQDAAAIAASGWTPLASFEACNALFNSWNISSDGVGNGVIATGTNYRLAVGGEQT